MEALCSYGFPLHAGLSEPMTKSERVILSACDGGVEGQRLR